MLDEEHVCPCGTDCKNTVHLDTATDNTAIRLHQEGSNIVLTNKQAISLAVDILKLFEVKVTIKDGTVIRA
jgi:hypothetical protein